MSIKALVEIPQFSRFKLEIKDSKIILDRPLNQPIPYSYGYFPGTLQADNDPLDVFIIADGHIPSLTEAQVEIIGGFKCLDNGVQDDKLIAILSGDRVVTSSLPSELIRNYLRSYKSGFEILKELNKEEALKVYEESKI